METKTQERLREIANKKASSITAEDKAFVKSVCAEVGVAFNNKGCKQCVIDAAVQCFVAMREDASTSADDGRKYVLRNGVDVLFCGMPVNEAVMTDELGAELIRRGFDKSYFERCE